MRTKVVTKSSDQVHKDWKNGEEGYIDGYVRGGTGAPLAAVVLGERIVLIPLNVLKVTGVQK